MAMVKILFAHSVGLELCFVLPGRRNSLRKIKTGAALDALPGQRRDIVAGSKLQDTFQLGLSPAGAA